MEGVSSALENKHEKKLVNIDDGYPNLIESTTEGRQSGNSPNNSWQRQLASKQHSSITERDHNYKIGSGSLRSAHPLLKQEDNPETDFQHRYHSSDGRHLNKGKSFDDACEFQHDSYKREQRHMDYSDSTQNAIGRDSYLAENEMLHKTEAYARQKISQGAHAVSQGSVKNILILGTAGAGKHTIAKNLSTCDEGYSYTNNRDKSRGIGQVQCLEIWPNRFVLIDTAGPQFDQKAIPNANLTKQHIESYLKEGISLIIVVVRKDCGLPEEFSGLALIIESLFSVEARSYIALVHTGCELLEKDQRNQYIKDFETASGPANRLSSLCKCGTIAVGFPDIYNCTPNYLELFHNSISDSRKALKMLVKKKAKYIQCHSDIFKKKLSERMQLFQSSGVPDCTLM